MGVMFRCSLPSPLGVQAVPHSPVTRWSSPPPPSPAQGHTTIHQNSGSTVPEAVRLEEVAKAVGGGYCRSPRPPPTPDAPNPGRIGIWCSRGVRPHRPGPPCVPATEGFRTCVLWFGRQAWGKLACARGGGHSCRRKEGGGGSGKWTPVTGRPKEPSLKALMMTHHVRHEHFFAEKVAL